MLNGTRLPYFSAEYLDAWQLREQHEEDHCFETAPQTLSEAETDLSDGDETDKTEESSHLSAELHGVEHGSKVVSVVKSDEPQDVSRRPESWSTTANRTTGSRAPARRGRPL